MKILRWLDRNLEEKLMMILLMAMVLIMGIQVICRYVFNNSLSWTEEITRFLFVWTTFLSIGYCMEKQISLRIDQLTAMLPDTLQIIVRLLVLLISLTFFAYMIPEAWNYTMSAVASRQKSSATNISMAWVQGSTVVGFVFGLIRSVQEIFQEILAINKRKNTKD
ncbi:TRAP transporter small permease [Hominifimenecus sp. rT4P-3]|uniref:TRAP transporter small permease n=1 Tax=Hominifimenecus sp. rT4P-3 TaxID=3242979 RepID=UPI003DA6265B